MYQQKSYGKWILAGEHAVLRGGTAIVYPLKSRYIEWTYRPHLQANEALKSKELHFNFKGVHGQELEILILGLIDKALENLNISRNKIQGEVEIFSNIPLGSGLGASAALCVSVTRWLFHLGFLKEKEMFQFAKNLEDLFHGESSGVDVAVSLSGHPIIFNRETGAQTLNEIWQPKIGLTYSGHRGMTKDCVDHVKQIFKNDPTRAQSIDLKMKTAVEGCIQSLTSSPQENQFETLQKSMMLARNCFEEWGLVDLSLENEMNLLLKRGAKAVKPTGSGLGGYVLSLWDSEIPKDII